MAEDVEMVNPDLLVRDKEGKPYSVRYDQSERNIAERISQRAQNVCGRTAQGAGNRINSGKAGGENCGSVTSASVKYWEISGWNCGCISSTGQEGGQFWVVAAEGEHAGVSCRATPYVYFY